MKSTCNNTTIITITIEYYTHRPFDPGKMEVNTVWKLRYFILKIFDRKFRENNVWQTVKFVQWFDENFAKL